jgi:SAM-dependent methyltransferase
VTSARDPRAAIYDDLHGRQLAAEEALNYRSAERIIEILFRHYTPESVLDVGCGLGTWLKAMQAHGVADVAGIEGDWLAPARLQVDANLVSRRDLEQPFDLGRRFDLVVSLEVAEHLSEAAAPTFVESLVRHAPVILFSAALPFQGGHHHVNEKFPPYWAEHFARHEYAAVDLIRGEIWDSPDVLWWLRQNALVFAHRDVIAGNAALRTRASVRSPMSIVHPVHYGRTVEQLQSVLAAIDLLRTGGLFRAEGDGNGQLRITKVSE